MVDLMVKLSDGQKVVVEREDAHKADLLRAYAEAFIAKDKKKEEK